MAVRPLGCRSTRSRGPMEHPQPLQDPRIRSNLATYKERTGYFTSRESSLSAVRSLSWMFCDDMWNQNAYEETPSVPGRTRGGMHTGVLRGYGGQPPDRAWTEGRVRDGRTPLAREQKRAGREPGTRRAAWVVRGSPGRGQVRQAGRAGAWPGREAREPGVREGGARGRPCWRRGERGSLVNAPDG